jgi:hypothetical protein
MKRGAQRFVGCGDRAGSRGGSVTATVEVSVRHSGHRLSRSGGLSSCATMKGSLSHLEHEGQKCQMFSIGS